MSGWPRDDPSASPFLGEGGPESTMTIETAREISSNPELMKRLAKYLAQQCFRNTMLEDLHAGITPDSQTGDYTDVVVRSPYGEIPWPRLSRLSDEEMKALMIDVVNKTYRALTVLFDNRLGGELIKILAQQDFLRWNEPTLSKSASGHATTSLWPHTSVTRESTPDS
jgi:hypothetical protein